MNWNDLKVFLAITESGSLSGAAKQLAQNHSTVFRRLNALEESISVRLFDRSAGHYVLTPAGERMRELVRETDHSIQKIERELVGQDIAPSGKVRITSALSLAKSFLVPVVGELRKSYPGILVEIAVGDSDYDLNRREADIALRATNHPPQNLIGKKITELDWWICGAAIKNKQAFNSLEDIRQYDLIGADSDLIRLRSFQWLDKNLKPSIVCRSNDLSAIAELARAKIGLALLPADHVDNSLKKLFKVPDINEELWLLTHPDLRNVRRIRVVWDAIVKSAATIRSQL